MRPHLALSGGAADIRSPYATTSAVSYQGPPISLSATLHPTSSSGYGQSYFRNKPPPPGNLDGLSVARNSFSRPATTELKDIEPWPGPKDATPLSSCMRRGETKEPRYYPFTIGSPLGAQALIQPAEDPAQRFSPPSTASKKPDAKVLKWKGSCSSGFAMGNGRNASAELISAPQGQDEYHTPALTMLQAERVSSDSTRRYFHARDYYDDPWLTSSSYYQADCLAAHRDMQARKESLTAVPSTRPLTQYALAHNDAPYAPDTDDSWYMPNRDLPGPVPIEALAHAAAGVPGDTKLPTGFTRVKGLTNATGQTAAERPPAPPLPERFQRERARRDYLRWGTSSTDPAGPDNMYKSTSRMELADPARQVPVGGVRKMDARTLVVPTDSAGYHNQIVRAPII